MSAPGFEFFTSDDAGAPSLYGAAGRMIAVLDWVLVAKGGWAKAYSGTNLAAYRSATGNRFYLRVDDTQTQFARLRGYRAMTAISSGSNLFPATSLAPTTDWGGPKSVATDSTPRRYWGIRTNRYFFMFVETDDPLYGAANRAFMAFGDVPSHCETDTFNTVIVGADSPQSISMTSLPYNGLVATFGSQISGAHMAATPSGSANACGTIMHSAHVPRSNTYEVADTAHGKSGRLQLFPISLYSNEAVSGGSGIPILRGYLPNVQNPLGLIPRSGLADEESITVGSRTYKLLMTQLYDTAGTGGIGFTAGFSAIETTDTDGAL